MSAELAGGVFHQSLVGGRAPATVRLGVAGLDARTADGQAFHVAFCAAGFELGGTEKNVVFCHSADRETTIYCAEPQFLPALAQDVVDPETAARVEALRRDASRRRWLGRGVVWSAVLVLAALAALLPTIFGWFVDKAVHGLPHSVDQGLGNTVWSQMRGNLVLDDDDLVRAAMQRMLARLEAAIPEHYGSWEFKVAVVDEDTVNAFALPGGQMVFYSGLLRRAASAEEVAGVLAHEMGHILERHGLRRMAQSLGIVAGASLVFGDAGVLASVAAESMSQATINQYSRQDEAEADSISVTIMHRAGLDPTALGAMFERMKEEGEEPPSYLHWLSTHPTHDARIQAIEKQVRGMPGGVARQPLDIDWQAVRARLQR